MQMKAEGMFQRYRHWVLSSAMFLSACVTSLQTPPDELRRGDPDEGTVIGSLQIKGGTEIQILGRRKWSLELARIEDVRHPRDLNLLPLGAPIRAYTVQAYRDGDEELFVAKLPPGRYAFWKLSRIDTPTFTQGTEVYLTVQPSTISYVGRLVVEFPPGLISSTAPNRVGCTGLKFTLRVEDASAPTLEKARQAYGVSPAAVVINLMRLDSHSFCGHEYDSKGPLP